VRGGPPLRAADPTGKGGAVFHVTVLRARGGRLVKLFTADGRKLGTEKAARFCYEPLECRGARDFFAKMSGLKRHRDRCVIRAAPGRWFPDDGKPVFRLSDAQPAYMDNAGAGPRVLPGKVKQAGREPEIDDTLLRAIMLPMLGSPHGLCARARQVGRTVNTVRRRRHGSPAVR
jgi:hypothetical protein